MANTDSREWYKNGWLAALMIFIFFPIGLFLMWKYTNWNSKVKWGITGFIAILILAIALTPPAPETKTASTQSGAANTPTPTLGATAKHSTTNTPTPTPTPSKKPAIPAEYKSALSQANTYANKMHMSKQGVYDQLVSEYGGRFTAPAAQYAIDNVKSDWNANALAKAKTYQDSMHLSPAAIHDQLTSEYGEKFTQAEADYAIQHLTD